jgi:hypothetical protein
LFKEKYLSFYQHQPIGQLNLKAFLVKLILNLMLFCKTIKTTPFLIKESNQKLHLSTIKHLCHFSDLKLNEKQLNLQISLDNQFTWRYKLKYLRQSYFLLIVHLNNKKISTGTNMERIFINQ